MARAARILAALKRDGWIETRRSGSHRVLVKGDQQRIWAYHDSVDLGGPAIARIARDYRYTVDELRKLQDGTHELAAHRAVLRRRGPHLALPRSGPAHQWWRPALASRRRARLLVRNRVRPGGQPGRLRPHSRSPHARRDSRPCRLTPRPAATRVALIPPRVMTGGPCDLCELRRRACTLLTTPGESSADNDHYVK